MTASREITTSVTSPMDGPLADAAVYNVDAGDPHATAAGLPDLAAPGEIIRGKTVFGLTGDWDAARPGNNNVRAQIDTGFSVAGWQDMVITYGFFDHRHAVGLNNNPSLGGAALGEGRGYTPFTEAQKAGARIAVANWDEYIAPEFQEVTLGNGASGWAHNVADIWLANTFSGPAQAWAYIPTGGNGAGERLDSDVWIADPRFQPSNGDLFAGGYGLQTLNHELGHSLGLTHPGDYDFGDDTDGIPGPDPITFEGDAFYFQDNHQYTIMSYFDMYEAGNNQVDWNIMRFIYPSTPMVHDIWVVQQKYGVETSTRTGDSTYGFNSSGDVTNEAMKLDAGDRMVIFSIWDAGGNDTLDLSGYHTPSVIDLREGGYSSAGGLGAYGGDWLGAAPDDDLDAYLAYINENNAELGMGARNAVLDLYFGGRAGVNEGVAWSDVNGRDWLMENNIGIAYGAVIENAKGGYGDDRINGNQADNHFWGNDGADTFVIADHSGTTLAGKVIVDTSVDVIEDFDRGEGDRIDLSELDVAFGDLVFDDSTDTVTVDGGLQFVILGASSIEASDFIF